MGVPLKFRVAANNARAKFFRLPATLTVEEWARTLEDFGNLCAYCRREPVTLLEHFVPLSKGGGTTAGNCLPACSGCNWSKRDKNPEEALSAEIVASLRRYLAARSTGHAAAMVDAPNANLDRLEESHMLPKNRPPSTPGEILLKEFLLPMKISQSALAKRMGVPIQRINGIVQKRRVITPETAVLLSMTFNNSPQFWMNLQTNYDLWHAQQKLAKHG